MFCKICGAPSETEVCPNCAAARAQTRSRQPVVSGNPLKANLHYILAGLAVLAFIWGVLNVFSVFDVNVTVTALRQSESKYFSVSDVADLLKLSDASSTPIYLGNILFGVLCLAASSVGILYFLKITKNMPYYDNALFKKLVMGKSANKPALCMGLLVVLGGFLQFLMYMVCGLSSNYSKVSFGVNWTTWMMIVIFAAVIVLDLVVLSKKEK